ncbi:histidine phosphatase superfamily [Amylostereum chailletii]|nr:histidine phosphatase superfamily [Amylostereum chailletii]
MLALTSFALYCGVFFVSATPTPLSYARFSQPADIRELSSRDSPANRLHSYDGVDLVHVRRQVPTDDTINFNVLHHLSGIAPYFNSPGVGLQPIPPDGCTVESASYLLRHGDIYANDFDYETYLAPFTQKMGNFTPKSDFLNYSPLAFLANWTSPITNETAQVEVLTPTGAADAQALGKLFAKRYAHLLFGQDNLTVWAAASERSTQTAQNFMQGLKSNESDTISLQIIQEEEDQGADTLTPHESCPNYDGGAGSDQSQQWRAIFTADPIERFNAAVPSFNFTATDVVAMMEFCGYEMVINNNSDFCSFDLFRPEDWLGFEYMNDVQYNYNIGYGFNASPNLGTPWLSASAEAIGVNTTSTNATRPNTTAQQIFLSFTHREEPAFIVSALGLFNDSGPAGDDVNATLPLDQINYARAWRTSEILPFLGHVGLEKMSCSLGSNISSSAFAPQEYVRVLVNSAPMPLPGCSDRGPGDSCVLSEFASFVQARAQAYGDFKTACNTTNGTNTISFFQNITKV